MQKHLGSKNHSENEKQDEMIIPEWLFRDHLLKIKLKKYKTLKH